MGKPLIQLKIYSRLNNFSKVLELFIHPETQCVWLYVAGNGWNCWKIWRRSMLYAGARSLSGYVARWEMINIWKYARKLCMCVCVCLVICKRRFSAFFVYMNLYQYQPSRNRSNQRKCHFNEQTIYERSGRYCVAHCASHPQPSIHPFPFAFAHDRNCANYVRQHWIVHTFTNYASVEQVFWGGTKKNHIEHGVRWRYIVKIIFVSIWRCVRTPYASHAEPLPHFPCNNIRGRRKTARTYAGNFLLYSVWYSATQVTPKFVSHI